MNDNDIAPAEVGAQTPADIDMSFLQQFSCMGTTDHDELVNQLQMVIGGPLSVSTAKFFLEMNNWNLQAAVGSYFDYHVRLPSMRLSGAPAGEHGKRLPPGSPFSFSWTVQNDGEDAWPVGCYLRCTTPVEPMPPNVPVASVEPGAVTALTVHAWCPAQLGAYQLNWQLFAPNGSVFGNRLACCVLVENGTADDEMMSATDGAGVLGAAPASQASNEDAEMC